MVWDIERHWHRRHVAPPATNFETLKDVLHKRKGMELNVSSSKALADSLDRCTVSPSFIMSLVKLYFSSRTFFSRILPTRPSIF